MRLTNILDDHEAKEQLNSTICRHFTLASASEHVMLNKD